MDFINAKTLKGIAPIRGLNVGRVLYRMHRFYCKPMKARGKCDYNCKVTCKENLVRMFRVFDNPKDKEALLVWRMREAVAVTIEGETERAVPVTDIFGRPKFDNVFEFIAEELNESEAKAR